ncbi:MAG: hypothetical protein FJ027_24230 [Candidatus Rokubacteria bacterium]|nr:hypothetical protein [Candidatus Rokubacteria bacterium]
MALRYRTETFQEVRRGDSILTSTSQLQVLELSFGARNARGVMPMRARIDGTDVADIFIDQNGQPNDFSLLVALSSDEAEAIEFALNAFIHGPVGKRLESLHLRLDRPERIEMPIGELLGATMKLVSPAPAVLDVRIVYAGHRLIEGARTVELRVISTLRGRGHQFRLRGQDEPVRMDAFEGETTMYVDPDRQFSVRTYQSLSSQLRAKGLNLTSRQVSAVVLDRTASKSL